MQHINMCYILLRMHSQACVPSITFCCSQVYAGSLVIIDVSRKAARLIVPRRQAARPSLKRGTGPAQQRVAAPARCRRATACAPPLISCSDSIRSIAACGVHGSSTQQKEYPLRPSWHSQHAAAVHSVSGNWTKRSPTMTPIGKGVALPVQVPRWYTTGKCNNSSISASVA